MNHFRVFTPLLVCFFIIGCAVGPDFHAPAAPESTRYTEKPLPAKTVSIKGKGGKAQYFQAGQTAQNLPEEWWKLFHSNALNALITQGLANSPTLDAAEAALRQAQETWRSNVGSGLFPTITAQLGASREQGNNTNIGVEQARLFNLYNASANVSYNLDVFGGTRRYLEQLHAAVDYQQFQWEAARLTLTANIVTTAVAEASLRAQISATEELIRSQSDTLQIVQKQFRLGGASQTDVLSQQTLLAQTRATLPPLQKSLEKFRHSLAVLVGLPPGEAHLPVFHLNDLSLPQRLPVTLPSQLVQQRPDIRASEALLHQASAAVGVAIANRLPQFPLTATYGYSSNQLHQWFNPDALFWSIGGQITQTIFDAGALKAKQGAAVAAYDQAAAQYRQVVLQAFQNVADSLYAIEVDAQALKAQVAAEKAARALFVLTQRQYKLGAVNYLDSLVAERAYQQTRIARIQAEAARYSDTAALFQALGGGWWNRKVQP